MVLVFHPALFLVAAFFNSFELLEFADLGHQTTWYLQEYTTLLFDLNLVFIFVLYYAFSYNTNKRIKPIEKHRVFQSVVPYIPIAEARGFTALSVKCYNSNKPIILCLEVYVWRCKKFPD